MSPLSSAFVSNRGATLVGVWLLLWCAFLAPPEAHTSFTKPVFRTPEVIAPSCVPQVSIEPLFKLEIGVGTICGNDPVNRHDPLGLYDGVGDNWFLDKADELGSGSIGDRFLAMPFGLIGSFVGAFTSAPYVASSAQVGLAQARVQIDQKIDSGEYGFGTALMARSLQFMGGASAGVTLAPLQPKEAVVGIATAPVVLPFSFGNSVGNFGVDPSLSGGFDVLESGFGTTAMFGAGFALQSRFPALQNLRVPSMPQLNLGPTWNPLNYRLVANGVGVGGGNTQLRYVGPKGISVGPSGHHVPGVRKSLGRLFEVARSDKTRPTIFSRASDPAVDHWRLHDAERPFVGPRQGPFLGTDDELFAAYRQAYQGLDDIRVDVRSPDGTHLLGSDVSPLQAINLIEIWLRQRGLR